MEKFSVLEHALFKPYHNKLIPLMMLEMANKKIKSKKAAELSSNNLLATGIELASQNISVDHAYEQLVNSSPKNDLEEQIKSFFIENLPGKLQLDNEKNQSLKEEIEIVKNHLSIEDGDSLLQSQISLKLGRQKIKNGKFVKVAKGE